MSKWQQVHDDQGTQETSWENPDAQSVGTWKTYTTEDGKEYYYNETTGVTTWDKPSELSETEETNPDKKSETETQNVPENVTKPRLDAGMLDLDRKLAAEPLLESKLVKVTAPSNAEDAKVQFQAMLKEGGVDSTWSFEKVIKTFVKNQHYWAIDDAVQRRTLYEDYLVKKLEQESSNKSGLIEEFKKNFLREIQKYLSQGKITHKTRWVSAKNLLTKDQNPVFEHSILPDAELEKLFDECTEKLRLEENQALQKEKDQALSELEGYLLQITAGESKEDLLWDDLYTQLQTDARFKANKHFHVLTKLDILQLVNYRSDRHARDAFKALLATKNINANTTFKSVLPELENEDAFIEICGRNGSTPLELFWDIVEEKRQLQKVKKDLIEHSLRAHLDQNGQGADYEDTLDSFDAFLSTLRQVKDERLASVDLVSAQGTSELARQHEQSVFKRKRDTETRHLAEWLAAHKDSIDSSILVFEKAGHTEAASEIKVKDSSDHSTHSIISLSDRDATVKRCHVDVTAWKRNLGKVEAFERLSSIISHHHKKTPAQAEPELHTALTECVKQVSELLTSSLSRKRPAAEIPVPEAKRTRPEGEKKPVLMNY
ncbi:hypothetical protein HF325_005403 [Metschnikowia pulcherrima]|uniref:Pre-mRNA-processing factor 40 n=1 Tax=Metschnikowia pulcherrima TaxID=27326 RepID=A0A8H7GN30_9ASCO|nr:hypothetical protein HF325_005403 [Metschnikowia pulcherrima]